jgi:hypothetical protein
VVKRGKCRRQVCFLETYQNNENNVTRFFIPRQLAAGIFLFTKMPNNYGIFKLMFSSRMPVPILADSNEIFLSVKKT